MGLMIGWVIGQLGFGGLRMGNVCGIGEVPVSTGWFIASLWAEKVTSGPTLILSLFSFLLHIKRDFSSIRARMLKSNPWRCSKLSIWKRVSDKRRNSEIV